MYTESYNNITTHFTGNTRKKYLNILDQVYTFEARPTNLVKGFLKKELLGKIGAPRRI